MFKWFVVVAVMVMVAVGSVHAEVQINTSGLSDAQKAELVKQAEEMKKAAAAPAAPDKVAQWIDLGKNAGLAFTSFAKEVGVAGDKFLESTTGKLVVVGLIFSMSVKPIMHFGGGLLVLLIAVPIWFWSYRKQYIDTIHYDKETGKKTSVEIREVEGEKQFLYFIAGGIIIGVSLLCIFTF